MWDGQEVASKPWEACTGGCKLQGGDHKGRLSSMIIYKGLSDRKDRKRVPLPFGNGGGILYDPKHVRIDCAYQGRTWCTPTPCTSH